MGHFCENSVNLGRIDLCTADIDTGIVAGMTGDYVSILMCLGVGSAFDLPFTAGDTIIIPNEFLPKMKADYMLYLKITDPTGQQVGCFEFQPESACAIP
jgi:hypothetical protein